MEKSAIVISKIEKRVFQLDELEKLQVTCLVMKYDDGEFTDKETLAYEIADELRTNENCIYDILSEIWN